MNVREDSASSSPPQPAPPPFPPSPTPEEEEEDIVMSEVHLGCPPNLSGPQISRFTFSLPPVEPVDRKYIDAFKDEATPTHQVASLDEDGDLVVTRRCRRSKDNYVVTIKHNITSSIPSVGLQVAYLALEKRYNFTLDDLNVVANGYSRFRSYLRDEGECNDLKSRSLPYFVGKRIDLTQIPQYVREYDRGNDVELWQIKYEKRKP